MDINLEINRRVKCWKENVFFKKIAQLTIQNVFDCNENEEDNLVEISVALVSKKEIKKINWNWRGVNNSTDVLSFAEREVKIKKTISQKNQRPKANKQEYLGEIILCCDFIAESAIMKKRNKEKELAEVFSHGILHLLGLSHGKKMFDIQKKVCQKISGLK